MNIEFILERINSHLDNHKHISEKVLKDLFDFLGEEEYQKVKTILYDQNICLVEEEKTITTLSKESTDSIINENSISESRILEIVSPYLNNKNEILETDFNRIFKKFSLTQQYQITDILLENNIFIEYDDEDEILFDDKEVKKSKNNCGREHYINITEYEHPIEIINGDLNDLKSVNNEQLCLLFQQGHDLALHLLIQNNKRLVYKRVKKYEKIYNHKLDLDDLYSYGNEGLIEAAKRYEFNKDVKFTTFAIWWIDQKIRRAIIDYGYTVRFPVHRFEELNKLMKLQKVYNFENEKDLIEKAQEEIGFSYEKISELLKMKEWCLSISSLNTFIGEDQGTELIEMLEDHSRLDTETRVTQQLLIKELYNVLGTLTDKERRIIKLRFGLDGNNPQTLEEIGYQFSVTRERIRQIEAKALRKLRHPSRANRLIDFIEV